MDTIKVKDVTRYLETHAPRALQEEYDNSRLLTGGPDLIVKGILVTLDCTEAVVDEAVAKNCNVIVAHHPIVFKGLKSLTGANYVERTVIKAIRNDIAIYAIHTNLDNVLSGVNKMIADRIGLVNVRVLAPKAGTLLKLVTFVPLENSDQVLAALYDAGAGQVGRYRDCSFVATGVGSFTAEDGSNPAIGEVGKPERVAESRIEVILPKHLEASVLKALTDAHPYEEVAYYVSELRNRNQHVGSGIIGELPDPMEPIAFLKRLKLSMNTACIRHTAPLSRPVKTVAVCGGSGSFLLAQAIRASADAYVSADFKYHEFFDADGRILIADIGHYESEQFTKELLHALLSEKFTTFAINFSESLTNPISYL